MLSREAELVGAVAGRLCSAFIRGCQLTHQPNPRTFTNIRKVTGELRQLLMERKIVSNISYVILSEFSSSYPYKKEKRTGHNQATITINAK